MAALVATAYAEWEAMPETNRAVSSFDHFINYSAAG